MRGSQGRTYLQRRCAEGGTVRRLIACVAVGVTAVLTAGSVAGQSAQEQLVVYGDLTYFLGPGKPLNCTLNNRYKKGDPVGFRATAINPATGKPVTCR